MTKAPDTALTSSATAERTAQDGTSPAVAKAQRLREGTELATQWLAAFEGALAQNDVEAIGVLFHPDCFWRDMLATQWNFRTHSGRQCLVAAWREALAIHRVCGVRLEDGSVAVVLVLLIRRAHTGIVCPATQASVAVELFGNTTTTLPAPPT